MIEKVVLTEAEEKFVPPKKEIELTIVGDNLFITVFNGSDGNIPSTKVKEYEVPMLSVKDVVNTLAAFGVLTVGYGIGSRVAE